MLGANCQQLWATRLSATPGRTIRLSTYEEVIATPDSIGFSLRCGRSGILQQMPSKRPKGGPGLLTVVLLGVRDESPSHKLEPET